MPTNTHVDQLKINRLTKAQYDAAVLNNVIGDNELSIITDLYANIQLDTMPTASANLVDQIYEYVGTTDTNYTNGYFYKCVSDGGNPATYSWQQISVQPQGSSSLSTLSDVTITSATSGQVLSYNGSGWENATKYAVQIVDYTA